PIQYSDQFVTILISLSTVVTTVIFSELLFRRFLIPKLEKQGMTPISATLASSLIFAFFFAVPALNLPEYLMMVATTIVYLINGSPAIIFELLAFPFAIINGSGFEFLFNFWIFLLIGLTAGYTYIITRNITLCFVIHSYALFLIYFSSMPFKLLTTNIQGLFSLFSLVIILFGTIVGIFIYKSSKGQEIRNKFQKLLSKRPTQSRNEFSNLILTVVFGFIVIDIIQFNTSIIPIFLLTLIVYLGLIVFFTFRLYSSKKKKRNKHKNRQNTKEDESIE
ncbi:MAG: CPBP family glutamic-type intramembrane protease, partial [Candidatus Hodarchaeales archaeon]